LGGLTRRRVRTSFGVLLALVGSVCLGIAAYLYDVRSSATALIRSAQEIRTKANAEREIAVWSYRRGKDFWRESNHPGGDRNYDGQISNAFLMRFPFSQPTVVTVSITMRDGRPRCVTVIESSGWHPLGSVQIQEWFDQDMPRQITVSQKGKPRSANVEFPSTLLEDQRVKPFAISTKCLMKLRGCSTANEILPEVWGLQSDP
jgi:hypothetical protein